MLKSAKKYETFQDLKSVSEKKVTDKASLKKHNDFEKFIKTLSSTKLPNSVQELK